MAPHRYVLTGAAIVCHSSFQQDSECVVSAVSLWTLYSGLDIPSSHRGCTKPVNLGLGTPGLPGKQVRALSAQNSSSSVV